MTLRKNLCKFNNSDKKRYCGAAWKTAALFYYFFQKKVNAVALGRQQMVLYVICRKIRWHILHADFVQGCCNIYWNMTIMLNVWQKWYTSCWKTAIINTIKRFGCFLREGMYMNWRKVAAGFTAALLSVTTASIFRRWRLCHWYRHRTSDDSGIRRNQSSGMGRRSDAGTAADGIWKRREWVGADGTSGVCESRQHLVGAINCSFLIVFFNNSFYFKKY